MKIEEAIKQKKFASTIQKVAVNLHYTNSYVNTLIHAKLKPFGISIQQFNVLKILKGQYPNPASINLIGERMVDKMSNASRLVQKLKEKELLERIECESVRRLVDITITNKGIEILAELDVEIHTALNDLCNLDDKELNLLNDLLDKLRVN